MEKLLVDTTPLVRRVNLGRVLAVAAAAEGAITGSAVMAQTGLTRATVHAVCNELIKLGWLREMESMREAGNRSGRPSRWFQFNERAGCVLGVDAGAHSSTLLVADLRGATIAAKRVLITDPDDTAVHGTDVRDATVELLGEVRVPALHVLAVGMGVAARVELDGTIASEHETSQASYQARRFAVADLVAAPVLTANDANLAALAERWKGVGQGVDNLAVVLAGERLGVGLLESGRLLRGSGGGAGELGWLDMLDGVGSAEGVAVLARSWGAAALRGRKKTTLTELSSGRPTDLTAEMVFAAAAGGDRVALEILDRIAIRLARVVAVLGTMFNPELVVLAGAVSNSTDVLLDSIGEQLPALTATPPRVASSPLGESVVSVGAVRLALDHVRDHALDIDLRSTAVS
ncbi:ROK family protein [Nakamurella sp. GG22]